MYVYSYIIHTCIIINMLHTLRVPSMYIKCIIVQICRIYKTDYGGSEIQLPLKRLPDSSVSSVDGWRQEGHLVKSRSTGSNTHGWTLDNCLTLHSWVLVDYPDADLSAIVVDSTSVSPKVYCLPCQEVDPSLPRKSDVFQINEDNYINEICWLILGLC